MAGLVDINKLRKIALACSDHTTTDALDRIIAKAERAALSQPLLANGLPETEATASVVGLVQRVDGHGGIADLRDAKWLDPECAHRGACQSLIFKAAQPPSAPLPSVHLNVERIMALAEKMMRDSWQDGTDASWKPAADELRAALELAAAPLPSVPAGFTRLIAVNDSFDEMLSALDRADRKGYMPDAMADEWAAFTHSDVAAAPQPMPAAPEPAGVAALTAENEQLRVALRFYARGKHYHTDEAEEFDTVSGEPQNWLCSGLDDSTTMIEDGRIARFALQGETINWIDGGEDETPQPIEGERSAATAPVGLDAGVAAERERCAGLVDKLRRRLPGASSKALADECAMTIRYVPADRAPQAQAAPPAGDQPSGS